MRRGGDCNRENEREAYDLLHASIPLRYSPESFFTLYVKRFIAGGRRQKSEWFVVSPAYRRAEFVGRPISWRPPPPPGGASGGRLSPSPQLRVRSRRLTPQPALPQTRLFALPLPDKPASRA